MFNWLRKKPVNINILSLRKDERIILQVPDGYYIDGLEMEKILEIIKNIRNKDNNMIILPKGFSITVIRDGE